MIDIHSHILPNLDDGARSLEESLEMVRIAAEDGIEQMVATPHAFNGLNHDPKPDEVLRRVNELQEASGSILKILPGNEVHITHDVFEKVTSNQVTKLNQQNYILIELPAMHVPSVAEDLFTKLHAAGIIPILAHPERNLEVQHRPAIVGDLIHSGARMQVTAMSVAGKFGARALECVQTLLEHNCVHFIATDSHRSKGRPPVLSAGRDAAAAIIGAEAARKLVEDNPRAVIQGEMIEIDAPLPFESPSRKEGRAWTSWWRK